MRVRARPPRDSDNSHPDDGVSWFLSLEVREKRVVREKREQATEGKGQADVRSPDANTKAAISD